MINWYLEARKTITEIRKKALDASSLLDGENPNKDAARTINGYLKSDSDRLATLWAQKLQGGVPGYLLRHISWGMLNDYQDIVNKDLAEVEQALDGLLQASVDESGDLGFEGMLHPAIKRNCYQQYRDGHLRDAVLNSVVAVFDLIRKRTGLDADGDELVGKAFSLSDPFLVLSDVDTESGKSDQKGFMQIFKGVYQGIRNPKAHTLNHDLTEENAAQYLVFASLLARRIDEASSLRFET